jgi:adenine deaminase
MGEVLVKENKVRENDEGSEIARRIRVALGQEKADLVILNGALVNVYTREIQRGCSVAVAGPWICSIGEDLTQLIGAATQVIDAQGAYITPGFIDPHTHLDSIFQCAEYARYAVPRGNTTAVTETSMIANAQGIKGVTWFIEDSQGLPLRIYILAPSLIPPFPALETSAGFSFADFQTVMMHERCLGIGESYWPLVVEADERAMTRYALAHSLGKTREGHAAGARGKNLVAYAAAGTTSCHEATSAAEALARLRLGMWVMVREGSIRQELKAIAEIKDHHIDMRRMMLCTDLADPEMLIPQGCMDELVRRAVAYGIDPVIAIQMVTINPAQYYGLRDLGGIAPGMVADVLLLGDLQDVTVKTVIKDGAIVAEAGHLVGELPRRRYPDAACHTFSVAGVSETDFHIPAPSDVAIVRAVAVINETITQERQVTLQSRQGGLIADPSNDVIKMAHINRRDRRPRPALGFVHGLGIREGAVATSLIWDTCNILVVGATEQEMALAVKCLLEHQGGFIVVKGDRVLAEYPLPVCGIISDLTLEEIARQMKEVQAGCRALGCTIPRPFVTLQTLPFTGLPYLRLTDKGLVDIRKRTFVDLVVL